MDRLLTCREPEMTDDAPALARCAGQIKFVIPIDFAAPFSFMYSHNLSFFTPDSGDRGQGNQTVTDPTPPSAVTPTREAFAAIGAADNGGHPTHGQLTSSARR